MRNHRKISIFKENNLDISFILLQESLKGIFVNDYGESLEIKSNWAVFQHLFNVIYIYIFIYVYCLFIDSINYKEFRMLYF